MGQVDSPESESPLERTSWRLASASQTAEYLVKIVVGVVVVVVPAMVRGEIDLFSKFQIALAILLMLTFASKYALRKYHEYALRRIIDKYNTLLITISSNEDHRRPRAMATTAIDAVVTRARKARDAATALLLLSVGVVIIAGLLTRRTPPIGLLILLGSSLIVINASALALQYRVSRGLFGTTEYEAREIVRFILRHSDTIDLSGGLGAREINTTPATEAAVQAVRAGAPAYE